jgi:SPP1 family predicted phage head-tail adaptor
MNDIAHFPIINSVQDDLGQAEDTEEFTRLVFCEKKSVPQSEFFQAGQSGIKASCVLVINLFDYQEETKVKYHEKIYHIYRTFERQDERIELYCEVRAGG